jgi:hypothetical protein
MCGADVYLGIRIRDAGRIYMIRRMLRDFGVLLDHSWYHSLDMHI